MHYEIEQASPDVGTHGEPAHRHVVKVFNADTVPMPLTFEALQQALAYVARTPGTLRVVEVTDEGERVPVDTATP